MTPSSGSGEMPMNVNSCLILKTFVAFSSAVVNSLLPSLGADIAAKKLISLLLLGLSKLATSHPRLDQIVYG